MKQGFLFLLGILLLGAAAHRAEAPKEGMLPGYWSSGVKQFYGTSYESYDSKRRFSEKSSTAPISTVWFTGSQGVLSEVFWPRVDQAQVRDSQLLVTDGETFFFEERQNAVTEVKWLAPGVPAFLVVNRDPQGRFEIAKTIFSDPDRPVVLQVIKIRRFVPGLKFYVLHNPSIANTPLGDHAFASVDASPGPGLYAFQGNEAQALVSSQSFRAASAGFEGSPTDGFQDLSKDFRLHSTYEWAKNGNVVLVAELETNEEKGDLELSLALGFASDIDSAHEIAWESLNRGASSMLAKYSAQWDGYLSKLRDLSGASGDAGALFKSSLAIMKSMEDKGHPGAFIASPAVPWGLHQTDKNEGDFQKGKRRSLVSGYHLVWPRDLFQMATGFMAVDDFASAVASLDYLKTIQYKPADGEWRYGSRVRAKDGSFPQNCWVDGDPHWGGLQLDEVAMPIMLAHRLWKHDAIRPADYWNMVMRASDFLADFGPWSPQERWEEAFGITPSTMAAEITALKNAAEYARAMGDETRSKKYADKSELWNRSLESWLFTTSGKHGNGRYYERIEGARDFEQLWDPNDNTSFKVANNAGVWREKDIVDGGFLELVRFGVRSASSNHIVETIPEYDATIRVNFSESIVSFRRYLGDRYNYDEVNNQQTLGMPWPILSGERGHYELARAVDKGLSPFEIDNAVNPFILSLETFATPEHMIPEQVWDYGPRAGKPTGAATPLGWAHAEYVKLLRSKLDRKVF